MSNGLRPSSIDTNGISNCFACSYLSLNAINWGRHMSMPLGKLLKYCTKLRRTSSLPITSISMAIAGMASCSFSNNSSSMSNFNSAWIAASNLLSYSLYLFIWGSVSCTCWAFSNLRTALMSRKASTRFLNWAELTCRYQQQSIYFWVRASCRG